MENEIWVCSNDGSETVAYNCPTCHEWETLIKVTK